MDSCTADPKSGRIVTPLPPKATSLGDSPRVLQAIGAQSEFKLDGNLIRIRCSSSNGKEPDSVDNIVKSVEKLLKEKSKLRGMKIREVPTARGSIRAILSKAFLIPLYELDLTYGGILRLTFGPEVGLLTLEHIRLVRRRSFVNSSPVLSNLVFPAAIAINLFGKATYSLCHRLDAVAFDGEDVEVWSHFSPVLTLDIIGKAVFNNDLVSLTNETGMIEVVYTVLRLAEDLSVAPIPFPKFPMWKDILTKQKRSVALKLVNNTLDDLIAICK
ncbi:hypothetical protein FEM48_Zijuj10G0078500 [Ziziphus jujuba var. spinosa]|uniref:Uncharacterized protein n=1 Tax=Ziziphus jujuba var. spinosa TaxID=714518 RepID=A0A978UM59_ZIZJJ|nr:hypothetical protein FEM48_Zijuj10G0078500 [Ziziphus jujuba var. spinosa]